MAPLVVHLSHTDVCKDARILRCIGRLADEGIHVLAVGFGPEAETLFREKTEIRTLVTPRRSSLYVLSGAAVLLGIGVRASGTLTLARGSRLLLRFATMLHTFVVAVWGETSDHRPTSAFRAALMRRVPLLALLVRLRECVAVLATDWSGYAGRVTAVHVHDVWMLPAGIALAEMCSARLIYDAHELESDMNGSTASERVAIGRMEKRAWHRIDLLVTVSPAIQQHYLEAYGPKDSVVVHNSPSVRTEGQGNNALTGSLKERLHLEETQKLGIYLGFATNGRGLHNLPEILDELGPEHYIALVGYGPLWEKAVNGAIHPRLLAAPAIKHHNLVASISDADYGLVLTQNVSTSDFLSLPNKLFELGFAGVPVIASNLPEQSRLVKEYRLGVVIEPSVAATASAIRSIVENPPRTRREEFIAEFNIRSQMTPLIRFYERYAL